MSSDMQVCLFSWVSVTMIVFLGAVFALDDDYISDRDKLWIGRIGLAAPLWPLMIVVGAVIALVVMTRNLGRAAKGER